MVTSDGSVVSSSPREPSIRVSRHECVFSKCAIQFHSCHIASDLSVFTIFCLLELFNFSFRPDDLVLFVPMIDSDKHMQQKTTQGVPTDEKTLSGDEKSPPWGSRSLAMLSSAIISTSLSPASQADTGVVEQWRMLSNDGHVYFLHDEDFDAFNLTRLSSLPATSAPGRVPTSKWRVIPRPC